MTYRVRKGDTLSSIARRYRTTPTRSPPPAAFGVRSPTQVGQRLAIPVEGARHRALAVATASAAPRGACGIRPVVHTVRRGETLYRIADHYQVTVDQICALNSITADGVLYPGTRLKIRTN